MKITRYLVGITLSLIFAWQPAFGQSTGTPQDITCYEMFGHLSCDDLEAALEDPTFSQCHSFIKRFRRQKHCPGVPGLNPDDRETALARDSLDSAN